MTLTALVLLGACSETGSSGGSLAVDNCRNKAAEEFGVAASAVTVTPVEESTYSVSFNDRTFTCEVSSSGDVIALGHVL